jgi:L-amino acid N-acyltransferase YncA
MFEIRRIREPEAAEVTEFWDQMCRATPGGGPLSERGRRNLRRMLEIMAWHHEAFCLVAVQSEAAQSEAAQSEAAQSEAAQSEAVDSEAVDSEQIAVGRGPAVAAEYGRLAGFVCARLDPGTGLLPCPIGEVEESYVRPDLPTATEVRRQLVAAAVASLRERGAHTIRHLIDAKDAETRELFERLGFEADMICLSKYFAPSRLDS